jgi:Ca-activated chloride channel family protein
MSGKSIMKAKEALASFIQTSHPNDEYFLIDFSSRPRLLLNRTLDGDAVLRKLTYVEPHGQTALYDAAYLALAHLTNATQRKRAVLIISDGQDNDSRYTFSELRRALKESDVTVYAIGTNPNTNWKDEVYGRLALEELASASGGKAFFPRNSEQMDEAFESIALELRHRYSIGYRPANFVANGKWHRVKVKVRPPIELKRVFVRNSEGYYAFGSLR